MERPVSPQAHRSWLIAAVCIVGPALVPKCFAIATMAGAASLRVPLEVNLAAGPSWAEAKA